MLNFMAHIYTLREIKASFDHSVASQPFLFRYVVRPVSFYFTYAVLRFRMTANQATLVGLFLGVFGSIFFIKGTQPYLMWGVVCYVLFLVFDFVDGNIARVTNSATYWGKFLDGVVDTFVEILLPLSLSIGYFLVTGSVPFLFFGIAISMLLIFSSFLFTRLSFFNRWMDTELRDALSAGSPVRELNPLKTSRFPLAPITNRTTDLKILGVVLIAMMGLTSELLMFILFIIAVHTIPLIVVPLFDAASNLNVRRISKWDPRAKK